MADYSGFVYGAVTFPIPTNGAGEGGNGASFLRDADPPLFYLLEYYKFIIEKHIGPRMMLEAVAGGVDQIERPVAETLPLNPEPYLIDEHIKFPLLAAYRKSSKFEWVGSNKHMVDEVQVAYVLPALDPGHAERMLPVLHAIAAVLDNRTEQGFDPDYTPTAPVGTAGEPFWERAGLAYAGVEGVTYGGYAPAEGVYFPAAIFTIKLKERSNPDVESLEMLGDALVNIDVADDNEPTVSDVVQFYVDAAPTLTLASPNSGTKAGGTLVTLTGTNFHSHLSPTIKFGGVAATDVVVVSETTIQCRTPAYFAAPTSIVDVTYEDINGLSASLVAGYTFTTP
jgi:hypothetical protein